MKISYGKKKGLMMKTEREALENRYLNQIQNLKDGHTQNIHQKLSNKDAVCE